MQLTIRELIKQAAADTADEMARQEAEWLLSHLMKISAVTLRLHIDDVVSSALRETFFSAWNRRIQGEPLAYLIGTQSFWDMTLVVTPDTLIPRPETESLVEQVLNCCPTTPAQIIDLGCGTGAIAIAVARERPQDSIIAVEHESAALAVARLNIETYQLTNRIHIVKNDWLKGRTWPLSDIIVSNPPYIDPEDPHLLGSIRFEPRSALVSEQQGYADLFEIIDTAFVYLKLSGWLLLEHGYDQGAIVRERMKARGYESIVTINDLNGCERVTMGQSSLNEKVC